MKTHGFHSGWMFVRSHRASRVAHSTLANIIGVFSKAHVLGKYKDLIVLDNVPVILSVVEGYRQHSTQK